MRILLAEEMRRLDRAAEEEIAHRNAEAITLFQADVPEYGMSACVFYISY